MLVNGDGQEKKCSCKEKKRKGIWPERLDLRSEIGSGYKSPAFLSEKEIVAVQSWPTIAMETEASQDHSCGIIIQKCWLDEHLNYGNIGWNADTMHMPTWNRLWYKIKMWWGCTGPRTWCGDDVDLSLNALRIEMMSTVTKWHRFTFWRASQRRQNIQGLYDHFADLHFHARNCSNRPRVWNLNWLIS